MGVPVQFPLESVAELYWGRGAQNRDGCSLLEFGGGFEFSFQGEGYGVVARSSFATLWEWLECNSRIFRDVERSSEEGLGVDEA